MGENWPRLRLRPAPGSGVLQPIWGLGVPRLRRVVVGEANRGLWARGTPQECRGLGALGPRRGPESQEVQSGE